MPNLISSTSFTTTVPSAMEATTTSAYHVIDQVLDVYTGSDLAMQLSPNLTGWKNPENFPQGQRVRICSEQVATFRRRQHPAEQMVGRL